MSEEVGLPDGIKKKTIDEWKEEIHETAKDKGWWEDERSFGEIVALIHSELSEALEEHREDDEMFYIKDSKPEGKAVELVDAIIRILDYMGKEDVDVEEILEAKMAYNELRDYRHGGKNM